MLKKSLQKIIQSQFMVNSIEGNIGSGKSTILSVLASRHRSIESIPEPVAEWTNMRTGVDLLKRFYQENEKWTFPFENLVQLSRLKGFYEAQSRFDGASFARKNIFIERSLLSSYNVFILNSYEQKRLNKVEFDILTQYYDLFSDRMRKFFEYVSHVDCARREKIDYENSSSGKTSSFRVIYLRTSPEICYQRVKSRSRDAESNISLSYLHQIHRKYEDWIERMMNETGLVEVVDANQSVDLIVKQIENILQ